MRLLAATVALLGTLAPAQDLDDLLGDLSADDATIQARAERLLLKEGRSIVPRLVPLIASDATRVRVTRMLGRMGAEASDALPALEKLLAAGDRSVRRVTARAILEIDASHAAATEALAKDDHPLSRIALCRALALGGDEALDRLLDLARSPRGATSKPALTALGSHVRRRKLSMKQLEAIAAFGGRGPLGEVTTELAKRGAAGIDLLLRLLASDAQSVCKAAAAALATVEPLPAAAAEKLRPFLRGDTTVAGYVLRCVSRMDPQPEWFFTELVRTAVRARHAEALRMLGQFGPDALKDLARSDHAEERELAAEGLGHAKLDDERSPAITMLAQLLQDPEVRVRRAAAHGLYRQAAHARFAESELVLALHDRDPRVRSKAVRVLGRLPAPEAERRLARIEGLLEDPDGEVRAAAVHVLRSRARLGAERRRRLFERFIAMLDDDSAAVRSEALRGIQARLHSGETWSPELLVTAFAKAFRRMRDAELGSLRKELRESHAGLVPALLSRPHPEVRVQTIRAVGELGEKGEAHLAALRALDGDPSQRVQVELRRTRARIGSRKEER